MRVDLGAGRQRVEGYISIDNNPRSAPDILWDLEKGLPKRTWERDGDGFVRTSAYKEFPDNTVDEFRAHHILEHLSSEGFMRLMDEMWDALKPDGVLHIWVPNTEHRKAARGDPTHKMEFHQITFGYFLKENLVAHPYTNKPWRIDGGYPRINGTPPDDLWEIEVVMRPDK